MTTVTAFRKDLDPIAKSLKVQSEKLKDTYRAKYDAYRQLTGEMDALMLSPPHRGELEALLGQYLDQFIAFHHERFTHLMVKFQKDRQTPEQARQDTLNALIQDSHGDEFLTPVMALLGPILKAQLPAIVQTLPWPEVTDPATRDQRLTTLRQQRAVLKTELDELKSIGNEIGFDLHRAIAA